MHFVGLIATYFVGYSRQCADLAAISRHRSAGDQYQTTGVIQKDAADGVTEHRFIRAETHPSKDDAATFAAAKGKQIIDQQGGRVFG